MKRLPLLLLPLLAACTVPPQGRPAIFTSVFPGPATEPAAPEPLPPQVLAALPPGVPPSVVQRNADGCYLLTIEVTDPPSGYPLRDAAGNLVCASAALPAGIAPLAPGSITPPAPIAPLNPG